MEESPIGNHTQDGAPDAKRRDERDSLLVLARIKIENAPGEGETVRVRNVSSGGLMAQSTASYGVGVAVLVELEGVGIVRGSVAWAEAGRIGIAFDHPVDKARARKPAPPKATNIAETVIQTLARDYRRPPVKPR